MRVWEGTRGRALRALLALAGAVALALVCAPPGFGFVYWSHGGAGDEVNGAVGRATLDGGNVDPSFIERRGGNEGTFCGVAVDGSSIFWAFRDLAAPGGSIGWARANGAVVDHERASHGTDPCGVAARDGFIYWARAGGLSVSTAVGGQGFLTTDTGPCGVARTASRLYWAGTTYGTIGRATPPGPTTVEPAFITGASDPCGVAVHGAHIYWANRGELNSIGRASLDGQTVEQTFISIPDSAPCGVAVDDFHVYWAATAGPDAGSIGRAAIDGDAASVEPRFIPGASDPPGCGVAVDELRRSTLLTLSCSPAWVQVGERTRCVARIADVHVGPGSAPAGEVALTAGGAEVGRCTLAPVAGEVEASCAIGYVPQAAGEGDRALAARYAGSVAHGPTIGHRLIGVLPSNRFDLVRTRLHARTGRATLVVGIPGRGRVTAAGGGIARSAVAWDSPGRVAVPIRPAGAARRQLDRSGRATVRPRVTFHPTGGDPRSRTWAVTLRKRR